MTNQQPTVPKGNRELATKLARVADALAEYDHLPTVEDISVGLDYRVTLYLSNWYSTTSAVRPLCVWAEAMNVNVKIVLSWSGSGDILIEFPIAGEFTAKMDVHIQSAQAYELGRALGRPITHENPTVDVTPADLLTAMGLAS
jgi:hypothetical protein